MKYIYLQEGVNMKLEENRERGRKMLDHLNEYKKLGDKKFYLKKFLILYYVSCYMMLKDLSLSHKLRIFNHLSLQPNVKDLFVKSKKKQVKF